MLLSHSHRFIYLKTRKTAGTSVESYFERFCMNEAQWSPVHHRTETITEHGIIGARSKKAGSTWKAHMSATDVRQMVGDAVWSSYLKFCVVRNPYERCVSHFFYMLDRRGQRPDRPDAGQFEAWLESADPDKLRKDRRIYMIEGRFCMDVIVRYEKLAADLADLCARLGVPWEPGRLPTFKSGIRPEWASVEALYSARAKEIVKKKFSLELREFGYGFPGTA